MTLINFKLLKRLAVAILAVIAVAVFPFLIFRSIAAFVGPQTPPPSAINTYDNSSSVIRVYGPYVFLGNTTSTAAKFFITGRDSGQANSSFFVGNSDYAPIIQVRNDGVVTVGKTIPQDPESFPEGLTGFSLADRYNLQTENLSSTYLSVASSSQVSIYPSSTTLFVKRWKVGTNLSSTLGFGSFGTLTNFANIQNSPIITIFTAPQVMGGNFGEESGGGHYNFGGSLGVGTTTIPSQSLSVHDNATFLGNTGFGQAYPDVRLDIYPQQAGSPVDSPIIFRKVSGEDTYGIFYFNGTSVGLGARNVASGNGLKFFVSSNTSNVERVRLTTSKKVGIGTGSPQGYLDVSGNVAIGSFAETTPPPTNGLIISGDVGFGTPVPSTGAGALNVFGSSTWAQGGIIKGIRLEGFDGIEWGATSTVGPTRYGATAAGSSFVLFSLDASYENENESAKYPEPFTYFSGGNVGFGVAPTTKLEIGGNLKTAGIQIGATSTSGYILKSDASGVGRWQALTVNASNTIAKFAYAGSGYVIDTSIYDNGSGKIYLNSRASAPSGTLQILTSGATQTLRLKKSTSTNGSVSLFMAQGTHNYPSAPLCTSVAGNAVCVGLWGSSGLNNSGCYSSSYLTNARALCAVFGD